MTDGSKYTWTLRVAANVRVLRQRRRWSAQQLSDETARHGHRISRSVIANRETGRASHVTVDDLVAYAQAFGVEPAELLAEVPPVACARCCDKPPTGYTCNACGARSS